jgi:hypothetical protein
MRVIEEAASKRLRIALLRNEALLRDIWKTK